MNHDLARSILKGAGYKLTGQRMLIYKVLEEHKDKHLTPEEIHHYAEIEDENLGIATVYRTLLIFDNLGIVQKLNIDDSGARYELVSEIEGHHHHHLICSKCSKVEEVRVDLLDEVEEKIEKSHGFKIENHELKFYGICSECSNEGEISE